MRFGLREGADLRFAFFSGGVSTKPLMASSNDMGYKEIGRDRGSGTDSATFVCPATERGSVSAPRDRDACTGVLDRASSRSRRLRDPGMSDTPEFIDLINRLRAPECTDLVNGLRTALDAEYRRGQADAARRIMEVAQVMEVARAEVSPASARGQKSEPAGQNGGSAQQPAKSSGRRAPPGAPDALVTRVLTERGSQGASSREIEALARSDLERMVSQSGIRFALDRGRAIGKYRNDSYGRWFLAGETES